jgi:hypothetical protein
MWRVRLTARARPRVVVAVAKSRGDGLACCGEPMGDGALSGGDAFQSWAKGAEHHLASSMRAFKTLLFPHSHFLYRYQRQWRST